MNSELLQVLSKMNGGSILAGQRDEDAERNIFSDDVRLFIDASDNKYYFFAEYSVVDEGDNFCSIQKATIDNRAAFEDERINPSDAYLILFWKVEDINEEVYSRVIKFEEDEMFYKKYCIYYTDEELKMLGKKLNEYDEVTLKQLIKVISNEKENASQWNLAIRIMTKIPFWSLEFPSAVMENFEEKVEQLIKRSKKSDIDAVLKLKRFMDNETGDAEELVDKLFSDYLGDFS